MLKRWIEVYTTELERIEKTLQKCTELKQIYHDRPHTLIVLDTKIKKLEQEKVACEKTLSGLKKRYS